ANLNANLHAHELAHQWFGDWVTVSTFDDVWIKEGMATLLAPEAQRAQRDAEKKGRLFGTDFYFSPTDAIRDRSLTGIDKYTSGPYQRAAWLLTQIRDRKGDEAFWQSLRHVLKTYAVGSIDSETFVRSFALDDATTEKVLRALDEKRTPSLSVSTNLETEGTRIKLNLTDPGGTMIAPSAMSVVDATGQVTSSVLVPDVPLELLVPTGGYLAPDEKEVHPAWLELFVPLLDDARRLAPLFLPKSEAALATFASRSAGHQERAVDATFYAPTFDVAAIAFPAFYDGLDSTFARRSAELQGCFTLSREFASLWPEVLAPILAKPSRTTPSTSYGYCGVNFATKNFDTEMTSLSANLDARSAGRFAYLSSFDYGAGATFDALSVVALTAPTLELRERALDRLVSQTRQGAYSPIFALEEGARWRDFFRARLVDAQSATRFSTVWRGVVGLRDDRALVVAGEKLHTVPLGDDVQLSVVCDAYRVAQSTRPDAWKEFQQAAQPWDTLGVSARGALMSGGATCVP
ncbi:MAG: M1 family aminopeptidase, partial [Polyangiaceae bacterium]